MKGMSKRYQNNSSSSLKIDQKTSTMLSIPLYLKSLMVGGPLEAPAQKIRWLLGMKQRFKHPELWELYLEEKRLPLVLQRILSNDSCGVDVGCHIGSFLSLLTKYSPNGKHIAFEASPKKSRLLKRRFQTVTIYDCAVSDKSGVALFQEDRFKSGYSRLQGAVSSTAAGVVSYEVKTCCLDDLLLDSDRMNLIKLDIEGAELAALQGAIQVIRKFKPVIIFECGSEYGMREQVLNRHDLYNFITQGLDYNILTFADFLFDKGGITFDEFQRCGLYPFRAFNFVALPRQSAHVSPRKKPSNSPISAA